MEDLTLPDISNPVEPIDLSIFKDHVQVTLQNMISSLPQKEKTLVLEPSCVPILDFFSDMKSLTDRGIRKDIVFLRSQKINTETPIIIYLVPAKGQFFEMIESQIKSTINSVGSEEKEHHVIIIPKINNECRNFLSKSEYRAYFLIHNLNIDIYPLDYDLMSLEDNNSVKDLYVNNNQNILSVLSRAIIKFETVFGEINYKYIKGDNAKVLSDILKKEEENAFPKKEKAQESENNILACVMLDRSVDFITPLLSQYTYEGMLDEYFGVNLNIIRVKPSILEKDSKAETMKVDLSRKDNFFTAIKYFHFNKIRVFLPDRMNKHKNAVEKGKGTSELKEIQKSLEHIKIIKDERQSVTNHINLADFISQKQKLPIYREYQQNQFSLLFNEVPYTLNEFYENEMGKKADMYEVLKLFCLENLTQSGIKNKLLDSFKKEFVNVYGFQEIILLKNLEKMKIIHPKDRTYKHDYVSKKLELYTENSNCMEPNDASYVLGGYCPITIRLIENVVKKGWGNIKDVLGHLRGEMEYPGDEKNVYNPKESMNVILLVFIGGITFSEIAAIRYLNKLESRYKFVILTTNIINCKKMLSSLRMEENKKEEMLTMKDYYNKIRDLRAK